MKAWAGIWILAAAGLICQAASAGDLKVGFAYWEDSRVGQLAKNMAECIESNIDIPVRTYSGEKLGGPRDVALSLSRGRIDMALLPIADYGSEWSNIENFVKWGYGLTQEEAVSYSNDEALIKILNEESRNTGLELIGVGWQYGTLVTAHSEEWWDGLKGKSIAGGNELTRNVWENMGGRWVDMPYLELLQALSAGYIDGAVVGEDVVQWGLSERVFDGIYWANDFSPVAEAIGIVMNKSNDDVFGGWIAEEILVQCRHNIEEYNAVSLSWWRSIPQVASENFIEVSEMPEDWKANWRMEAMKSRDVGEVNQVIEELAKHRYEVNR